jgi:nucleotide-binding universal stress UspA family protein
MKNDDGGTEMSETEQSQGGTTADGKGRVVVGVDGSPLSVAALKEAAAIAKWRGWTLEVVHVYHVYYPAWPVPGAVGVPNDFDTTVESTAVQALEQEELNVLGEGHGVDIRNSVVEGTAGHVLAQLSEGASLLVVGSRGASGVRSLVLGSVGNYVVHHAQCDVLIVRHGEDEPGS